MTPVGGILIFLHIAVIFFFWIKSRRKMAFISFFIIVAVAVLTFGNGFLVVKAALGGNSNFAYVSEIFSKSPCEPIPSISSGRMVALRLDDIQADAWEDISMALIDAAGARKIPLVLGVIPRGLEKNKPMYRYLKKVSCGTELAQHGWLHQGEDMEELPEFKDVSEAQALEKIMAGKEILEKLTGTAPETFIPPQNIYSTGTVSALIKTGFRIVSSEGKRYFDYTATTYDFPSARFISPEEIIQKCNTAFQTRNLCVILMHPQDFVTDGRTDEKKFNAYIALLDMLTSANVTFVKIRDVFMFTPLASPPAKAGEM